jgi:hypothetical protein
VKCGDIAKAAKSDLALLTDCLVNVPRGVYQHLNAPFSDAHNPDFFLCCQGDKAAESIVHEAFASVLKPLNTTVVLTGG